MAAASPWSDAGLGDGVEKHRRSIAKAISWRMTGSIDTFLLSWLLSGNLTLAGGIATTEVITKSALYYLHERAWGRIGWGRHAHRTSSNAADQPVGGPPCPPAPIHEVATAKAA
jgi:uncharacterized membrane protein